MQRMVSEIALSFNPGVERGAEITRLYGKIVTLGHATIFLKHPFSAMLISELSKTFDVKLVYVFAATC